MNFKEFLKESIVSDVDNIVDELNKRISIVADANVGMFSTKYGTRMWTRGDGSKYKEPSYIFASEESYLFNKYPVLKKKFKGTAGLCNFAMEYIKSLPKIKSIGKIKGEFGSSEYQDAYQLGNIIFIKTDFTIKFATKSILKNVDVWKKQ